MDNPQLVGHPDRDTVAMHQPYEVLQVAQHHRISTNMVYAVHKYLNTKSRTTIDAYIGRQKIAAALMPNNYLATLVKSQERGILDSNQPPSFMKRLDGSIVEDLGDYGPGIISTAQLNLSGVVR